MWSRESESSVPGGGETGNRKDLLGVRRDDVDEITEKGWSRDI